MGEKRYVARLDLRGGSANAPRVEARDSGLIARSFEDRIYHDRIAFHEAANDAAVRTIDEVDVPIRGSTVHINTGSASTTRLS